jgi:hypothetical protein
MKGKIRGKGKRSVTAEREVQMEMAVNYLVSLVPNRSQKQESRS